MFSQRLFIEASREFVCVRLETYENQFHEQKVRENLDGSFQNSAFAILDTNGNTQLSGSGRMPFEGLIGRKWAAFEQVIARMTEISRRNRPAGAADEAVLQDFHTFCQALNIASADQRLLLFVAAQESRRDAIRSRLRRLMADKDIIGKFHLDFGTAATDRAWSHSIRGVKYRSAYFVIRADKFGQSGAVVDPLPLTASVAELKKSMLDRNRLYAESEQRKAYAQHVAAGKQQGIFFEQQIPLEEDKDADGVIDNAKARREADRRKHLASAKKEYRRWDSNLHSLAATGFRISEDSIWDAMISYGKRTCRNDLAGHRAVLASNTNWAHIASSAPHFAPTFRHLDSTLDVIPACSASMHLVP